MAELPEGYTGLIIADARRAQQWQVGLEAAGIATMRLATVGKDSERGSWQIAVARADENRARAFVRGVIDGQIALPDTPVVPAPGVSARMALGVTLLMLVILALAVSCL